MTPIASIHGGAKTTALIGASVVVVAVAAVYLHRARGRDQRRRRSDGADGGGDRRRDRDIRSKFYQELGIEEEDLPPHARREIEKERRWQTKKEKISMKTPMYDNVFMLGPGKDGGVMCTISMKKARWYVKKGIGEWVTQGGGDGDVDDGNAIAAAEEMPTCIRLLFEPRGGSRHEDEVSPEKVYLRTAKRNACVSCGSGGPHHMRHYIVPYTYRTLLPDEYKTHMSHDIVILCPDCHVRCERDVQRRMKSIVEEARARAGGEGDGEPQFLVDMRLQYVRSCGLALVKWKDGLPHEKVVDYERTVREHLAEVAATRRGLKGRKGAGGAKGDASDADLDANGDADADTDESSSLLPALTKLQLQSACGVNYRVKNPAYVPGPELVVKSLLTGGPAEIERFVQGWRQYFLDVVGPRHMPAGWNVKNPVICGRQAPSNNSGDKDDEGDSMKKW